MPRCDFFLPSVFFFGLVNYFNQVWCLIAFLFFIHLWIDDGDEVDDGDDDDDDDYEEEEEEEDGDHAYVGMLFLLGCFFIDITTFFSDYRKNSGKRTPSRWQSQSQLQKEQICFNPPMYVIRVSAFDTRCVA